MAIENILYVGSFHFSVNHVNDDNGHLRHNKYFDYSDRARNEFLECLGLSDKNLRQDHGIKFVFRSRRVDYKLPTISGDEIDVQLEVVLDREPFLRMDYTFYNNQGEVVFTDKTLSVFVDEKTGESIPVPGFFLDVLKRKS